MLLAQLSRSVEGYVVLVTGAASGMGEATAKLFASLGARVALTDVNTSGLARVVAEIRAAGADANHWTLDVSDEHAIEQVVPQIADYFGALDMLINNAGIAIFAAIDAPDYLAAWTRSQDILLTAQMRMVRAALPYLRRSSNPRIVNIASTEGLGATRYASAYTAAKHGVIGLTRALAVDLGPEGITVNCVCPGPVNTAMTADIPAEDKIVFARRRVALKRYAEPEEIAHGVVNFCLPSSGFMTGVALPIDGGLTIRNA